MSRLNKYGVPQIIIIHLSKYPSVHGEGFIYMLIIMSKINFELIKMLWKCSSFVKYVLQNSIFLRGFSVRV